MYLLAKRLVSAKCNKVVIIEFLNAVVVQDRKILEGLTYDRQRTRRMALILSRDMGQLAAQLDSFQQGAVSGITMSWPVGFPLKDEEEKVFPIGFVRHLPSVLRGYAELLEDTWASRDFRQFFHSPPVDLLMLASYVRCFTGKPRYSDLCWLLDAAECHTYRCAGGGDSARGADALRNSINRFASNIPATSVRSID